MEQYAVDFAKLTKPQQALLQDLSATQLGRELHYTRGERGRTTVTVRNTAYQPRTADALKEAGYLEPIMLLHDEPKKGEVFAVYRLSPKGWNILGVPVRERTRATIVYDSFKAWCEEKEKAAPVQHHHHHKTKSDFTRAKITKSDRKARRKRERASRRANR